MGMWALVIVSVALSEAYDVTVSPLSPVLSTTEATFASWNVDSSCNRGFHHINFTNPNLLAAAKGLHPSRLRFGGSGNDNLVYGLTPGSPECRDVGPQTGCDYITPGCLNSTHWDNLHGLAAGSGTDFIFGVAFGLQQACKEGASYVWNATNAQQLLGYLQKHNQSVWGFELGNEVNNNGGAPCDLVPSQQAAAMLHFRKMAAASAPSARLVGPDTGYRDAEAWLRAYLPLVAGAGLHAVTHHVYGGINQGNFNSAATLDRSAAEIAWYTNAIRELAPTAQVWAGENGPTGGGDDGTCGSHSACGTYGTTIWYADDMSTRARAGFVQYQRQDLFGAWYGLTNSATAQQALAADEALVLRPDYWVNFLWKRIIGRNVHNCTSSSSQLRAYAYSGAAVSPFAAAECSSSSFQLILINLDATHPASVSLPSSGKSYAAWTLSPSDPAKVFGKTVDLNAVTLPTTVDVAAQPPTFLEHIPVPAVRAPTSAGVTVPPVSIAFLCY